MPPRQRLPSEWIDSGAININDNAHNTLKTMKYKTLFIILVSLFVSHLYAQGNPANSDKPIEKQTRLYAVKGTDSLYFDHYISPIEGSRPCLMFAFGGGFMAGKRDSAHYISFFEQMARLGYDVISIDYRLGLKGLGQDGNTPSIRELIGRLKSSINMVVEDIFSATRHILDNANEWQIDPRQIALSGSSAGAISALHAAFAISTNQPSSLTLPDGFNYSGIISMAGALFTTSGTPKWGDEPAPILMFHGNSDMQVPYEKATMLGVGFYGSKYISKQLDERGWSYWFYDIEYDTHRVANSPMKENINEIATFLEEFALKERPLQMHTTLSNGDLEVRPTKFKLKDYINANFGE